MDKPLTALYNNIIKIYIGSDFLMFKYFRLTNESTIDEVKKQYKKLAFKHHPDLGGSTEIMQEINAEYETALEYVGNNHNKNYSLDTDFINIIDALIRLKMQNVELEICGWFIYVTGNTKPYKGHLKELGLYWNSKKYCWYWKPSWYRKFGHDTWSMDKIRNTWGSERVSNNHNNEDNLQLA